jgi:hypothetical protein
MISPRNTGSEATSCLCPHFGKLRRLVIMYHDSITSPLLVSNADTLRYLTLRGSHLDIAGLNMRYITRLALEGPFLEHVAQSLSSLMTEGAALEELLLNPSIIAPPVSLSRVFRQAPRALSNLRIFKLAVINAVHSDADLFPAVVDFLRGRERLCMLQLSVEANLGLLGYDATVWGVLPSLPDLRVLVMGIPQDLAPGLAGWLLPRGLRAFSLCNAPPPMPLAAVLSVRAPHVTIHLSCLLLTNTLPATQAGYSRRSARRRDSRALPWPRVREHGYAVGAYRSRRAPGIPYGQYRRCSAEMLARASLPRRRERVYRAAWGGIRAARAARDDGL